MRKLIPNFMFPILQRLRFIFYIAVYFICSLVKPIDEKGVLFICPHRKKLESNALFIYNELKGRDLNIYTVCDLGSGGSIKKNLSLVVRMSNMRYVMLDDVYPLMFAIPIRKGQQFIQLWHAIGAFKCFGSGRLGKKGAGKSKSLTHKNYTDVIASSPFSAEVYASSFGIDASKVHPIGAPRTDIFFDKDYIERTNGKLLDKYPHLKGKNVVLFAPSFRGSGIGDARYPKEFIDFDRLYRDLKDDGYAVIIKYHPFTENPPLPQGDYGDFYTNLTGVEDVNDLIGITDVLITDYSSVIFEYAFTGRPAVMYAPDLADYEDGRGFYCPYEDYVYSGFCDSPEKLGDAVKSARVDEEKLEHFKDKFISFCDGNASKRFVKEIMGL